MRKPATAKQFNRATEPYTIESATVGVSHIQRAAFEIETVSPSVPDDEFLDFRDFELTMPQPPTNTRMDRARLSWSGPTAGGADYFTYESQLMARRIIPDQYDATARRYCRNYSV